MDIDQEIKKIEEQIKVCKQCRLHEKRTNAVPGVGSYNSEIMLIGEGPGEQEDLKAEPFVGAAGKFLDEMLKSINLERKDVYITNVVKCRPPQNRDPEPDEIETCTSLYLHNQIKFIQPLLVVTLGRHAMGLFLPGVTISKVHGKPMRRKGQVYFPCYHPAFALYNGSNRETLINDFKKIPKILKMIKEDNIKAASIIEGMSE